MKACLRMARPPVAPSWVFESTPVDILSTAVARIADDPAHHGRAYNAIQQDPLPADQVFAHMKSTGYVAELAPLTEWKSSLRSAADDPELQQLAEVLESAERYLDVAGVYDVSRFRGALSRLGLVAPPADLDYMTSQLSMDMSTTKQRRALMPAIPHSRRGHGIRFCS